jgi:predicted Zn-dependent protease
VKNPLLITVLLTITVSFTALSRASDFNLPDLGDESNLVMSPIEQKRLGEKFYQQALVTMDIVHVPELQEYLEQLGNRLTASIGLEKDSFTFFLVNDNSVNAFAVPGGYIGVHTGLLLTANNEAEVASVLGHEIAHVTQQHIPRMISAQQKNLLPNLATILAGILIGGQATEAAIAISSARSIENQLTYTRAFEREADRIGINILANSGYDTNSMADFFELMQRANKIYDTNAPQFLLTHPITSDRIAEAKSRAANYSHGSEYDNSTFSLVHAQLNVMRMKATDAITLYRKKIAESTSSYPLADHYGLALAYMESSQYAEAQKEASKLLAREPGRLLFRLLQAKIDSASNKAEAALENFRKIYAENPASRAAITYLVEQLIRMQQYTQARKILRKAVREHPKNILFYKKLALVESETGMMVDSHRATAEAYALQGNYKSALQQLKIARAQADKDDFYTQASITARIKEIQTLDALSEQK